jgi:NTP pyrophosphatase (non-canonical NTP hydrolase)
MKTAGPLNTNNEAEVLAFIGLALTGEAGELANKIKKMVWHNHPQQLEAISEELGDILWYVARGAQLLGIDLETIARQNIIKLEQRYPKGFDPERSRNRGQV